MTTKQTTRECAFCPEIAKRSGEHLWSAWINDLVPGKKNFNIKDATGTVIAAWAADNLNWKAKVVCEKCNNTWMSEIENKHARPAMTDLITGKVDVPVSESRARSIALFGFKTAVVFDHLRRDYEPFFDRLSRHRFRTSCEIPPNVGMWMIAFLLNAKGGAHTVYHRGGLSDTKHLETYVFTFSVGHLCMQVVGLKQSGLARIEPRNYFPAIPFWPDPASFTWPAGNVLRTIEDFDSFSVRWRDIDVVPAQI